MFTHKSNSSRLLLVAGVSFLAALFFSFYPNNLFFRSSSRKQLSHNNIFSITPTISSPVTPIMPVTSESAVKPSISPTQTQAGGVVSTTPIPSATAPVAKPAPTVNIQIIEPDGNFSFTVSLHDGNTICDSLTEAKLEGKIKSVTIDDSYMSSLHSAYVKEINGFTNNWTFTVNGQSPQGCSLYTPKSGDTIVWKFG